MKTEAAFYQQMRTAAKRIRPSLSLTRIENWAGQGIPDLLIGDEAGRFSFVELKFCRANAVNLSPHQVAWLMRHRLTSSWILIKQQRKPEAKPDVFLYHANQAIDVKTKGLKTEPRFKGPHPFDWSEILGLISPI